VSETPVMPTAEELSAAWTVIADADEAVTDIARKVFHVSNIKGETDAVTWERIGRLFDFVGDSRSVLRAITENVDKIEEAMGKDLCVFAREGQQVNVPTFSPSGGRHDIAAYYAAQRAASDASPSAS